MSASKAIPEGFMTVGQVAKKMNVTVRTLQYYDREGLFSPSAESDGGRRLYTDKDVIKLHQIRSMKHLGFSLDDIKNRLIPMNSPIEVAEALDEQAAEIRKKIESLTQALNETEALRAEVLKMKTVNFKKYADIIVNLQMKNDNYWLIKHFDDQTLDHIRNRFNKDSGMAMIDTYTRLRDEAVRLKKQGVPPESEEGQRLAAAFWSMLIHFTGGDMTMLSKLTEIGKFEGAEEDWSEKQTIANSYLEPALSVYFTDLGINPFEEEQE